MRKLIKKIQKIKIAIGVIRTIKNWFPTYFEDYFKLTKQKHIVYVLRNEIRYKVRSKTMDRGFINEIWIKRAYTPTGFEINEKDLVVDIGAHIGIFSTFASKFAKEGKIYSFEPEPENFELLKENIKINKIKNITPINKAMSNKKGQKKMFLSEDTGNHSFHLDRNTIKKINARTISLTDFVKQNNISQIDFLKMDCEGEEYNILFNCPNNILKIIRKISMEYHNIDKNYNGFVLIDFLEKKGFKVKMKTMSKNCGYIYAKR